MSVAVRTQPAKRIARGGAAAVTALAWEGWRLEMPDHWRPLSIQGAPRRGKLTLGDGRQVLLRMNWWRPRSRRFDPQRWLDRRVRSMGGGGAPPRQDIRPRGFEPVAWLPEARPRRGRQRAVWYGYAAEAGLVLEAVVNATLPARMFKRVERNVLPSLSLAAQGATTQWAVFGAGFQIPSDLHLTGHCLRLGDIALRFAGRGGRHLAVRQIYPAAVALKRRTMERWLTIWPFKEHKRYKSLEDDERWPSDSAQPERSGILCHGAKRLPAPLGWVSARRCVSACVLDASLDRLLLVQCEAPRGVDEALLGRIVAGMYPASGKGGSR